MISLEHTRGQCPRCGGLLDRADGEASPHVGDRDYVCPACGWSYETGVSIGDGPLL